MHSLTFVILFLAAFSIEISFAQGNCEIKTSSSGKISDVQKLRRLEKVEKCWIIKVPANSEAFIEVTKLTVDRTLYTDVKLSVGSRTEKAPLGTKFEVNSSTDTKVTFVAENVRNSFEMIAEFELKYNIGATDGTTASLTVATGTTTASPTNTIGGTTVSPVISTNEGDTEPDSEVQEALKKTLKLLEDEMYMTGYWREDTSRALIAIHLANGTKYNENCDQKLMSKDLELQILSTLSEASKEYLGMNINALVAMCIEPENFHKKTLLTELEEKVKTDTPDKEDVFVYLALCISGKELKDEYFSHMETILSQRPVKNNLDDKYYAAMALSCAMNRGLYSDTKVLEDISNEIMSRQRRDGSLDRDVTTHAQYVQIIMASNKTKDDSWNHRAAVQYLINEMKKSPNLEQILFTLPVFGGRTMADIRCNGRKRETFMSESKSQKTVSLRYEDSEVFTIKMDVKDNISAFQFLEFAAAQEPSLSFQKTFIGDELKIFEIAGIADDPSRGKYWQFYYIKSTANENEDLAESEAENVEIKIEKGLDKFSMKRVKELILWYKTS